MIDYNFISKQRLNGVLIKLDAEPVVIKALSLKKAIAKFTPPTKCVEADIYWTSRKHNYSKKVISIPFTNRKQRKGK